MKLKYNALLIKNFYSLSFPRRNIKVLFLIFTCTVCHSQCCVNDQPSLARTAFFDSNFTILDFSSGLKSDEREGLEMVLPRNELGKVIFCELLVSCRAQDLYSPALVCGCMLQFCLVTCQNFCKCMK